MGRVRLRGRVGRQISISHPQVHPSEARSQQLSARLPPGWHRSKHLNYHLLSPRGAAGTGRGAGTPTRASQDGYAGLLSDTLTTMLNACLVFPFYGSSLAVYKNAAGFCYVDSIPWNLLNLFSWVLRRFLRVSYM